MSILRTIFSETHSQLQLSVIFEDYDRLQQYIADKDVDLNNHFYCMCLRNEFIVGLTALHVSVAVNDLKSAQLLLQSGADVNARTGFDFGVNPKSDSYRMGLYSKTRITYTALHMAVITDSLEMTQLLIEFNADLNVKDHYLKTPLERSLDNPLMVDILIKAGADFKSKHFEKRWLIFRAIYRRNLELVELLGRLEFRCIYYENQSPIEYAMNAFPECVPHLVRLEKQVYSQNPKTGNTLLHSAIQHKNVKWVELLCNHGLKPNVPNNEGNRALHIAVQTNCSKEMILVLLSFGANPNLKNVYKLRPICYAIQSGNTELTELLFQYDSQLSSELTELENAIQFRQYKTSLILLNNIRSNVDNLSFDSYPIIWYFVRYSVGDTETHPRVMARIMQRLIELSSDVNSINTIWGTLMHYLIYASVCSPTECYKHLFKALIASPKCDVNQEFYPKDTQTKEGEAVPVERIMANGSALSFALELKGCEYFAEQLIRIGANYKNIVWNNIFFAPEKAKALKMLVYSGCVLPDDFHEYNDPQYDTTVAEEDIEFFAKEFESFNQWMNKRQTNPWSLKVSSRRVIRNSLGLSGCRRLQSIGGRVFGREYEALPKELLEFLQFYSPEDFVECFH